MLRNISPTASVRLNPSYNNHAIAYYLIEFLGEARPGFECSCILQKWYKPPAVLGGMGGGKGKSDRKANPQSTKTNRLKTLITSPGLPVGIG
ncbi:MULTISPECIES: hypothetical protein [unclassified Moorena]|uniref:hypothetical protein n=1 Tax=unclassified Moorena TaxID=2683338 RepID=UPI0013FEDDF1|nr:MULTISPECIES: hypothetical protein [unclassified Moorena]NEO14398.1 hypothetical protein [Moorena sp. SIO3E8]NEQ01993.1 hypothetical protein [Moorena sp. SIO3F7]